MTQARLISIDAVQAMNAALRCFHEDVAAALDDLDREVQRAEEWIQHDRRNFWGQEVRRGWDRVAEARVHLQQAQTFQRVAEHQPSCREEKKELDKANARLRTAQEKVEAARRWAHVIEKAVNDYRSSVGPVSHWIEADYPRALAVLGRMMSRLQSYIAIQAPTALSDEEIAGLLDPEQAAPDAPPPQEPAP